MEALKRVQYQSLADTVAQRIRGAIIAGELHPGDRLVEQKLAAMLGISQVTVREALQELEHQGFVRRISNKGSYVTMLDAEDIQQILEVRLPLEALAVEWAAGRANPEAALELERLVNEMESAVGEFDRARFHRADLEFHSLIWRLAGNKYLEKVLCELVSSLFAFVLSIQERQDFEEAVHQHRRILAALLSGDVAQARTVFFEETQQFWKRHYGSEERPAREPKDADSVHRPQQAVVAR